MAPAKESNPLPRAGLSVGKPNRLSLDNITRLLPGCFFFFSSFEQPAFCKSFKINEGASNLHENDF